MPHFKVDKHGWGKSHVSESSLFDWYNLLPFFKQKLPEDTFVIFFFSILFQSLKNPDRNAHPAGTDLQILSWSGIAGVHG